METILSITGVSLSEDAEYGDEGYKVTTTDGEINLMIDAHQECCEVTGFFWCNDDPQEFIGSNLLDIRLTDKALNPVVYDRNYPPTQADYWIEENYECGDIVFVDLVTDMGVLQFVAYNRHNGCYGHDVTIRSRRFNYKTTL